MGRDTFHHHEGRSGDGKAKPDQRERDLSRECAEERNAFQLEKEYMEKERERFNKELREQLMERKAFQAENSAMSDDRKSFLIEKEEMAMMSKAYIREKTGIQRSRVAIQLEKENMERERKAIKKDTMSDVRRSLSLTNPPPAPTPFGPARQTGKLHLLPVRLHLRLRLVLQGQTGKLQVLPET
ncbi:putative symporter [Dissostichus eleginoides]|uniref:Symporter n=1 Tax=Dissostichus eleginoides TaxID=100907 RepID=A0AAD9BPK7_DISEL|nr:putative symporter [Dissostichus eleginoides]